MNQALKGDMDQALQDLSTFKSDFHENNMMKNKRDAVNSVKTLLAKRLYSYF